MLDEFSNSFFFFRRKGNLCISIHPPIIKVSHLYRKVPNNKTIRTLFITHPEITFQNIQEKEPLHKREAALNYLI